MTKDILRQALHNLTDPKLLDSLFEKGQFSTFESGKTLMEPGQFIKAVSLVLEGSIKIMRVDEDGKELFLYYLETGETCALSLTCCSAARPSEIKGIVEEKASLLFIPIQVHEQLVDEFKQWKDFVSTTYQYRFQEMLTVLDAVAFKRMDERLMNYIVTKMKQLKSNELHTTHQEVANELGTAREVISRLFKQLEKKKMDRIGSKRHLHSRRLRRVDCQIVSVKRVKEL